MLSASTGCNAVIIRNLFAKLSAAGLLETKSGKGKTTLALPAEEITLWDIYTAVESDETDEVFKLHQNTSDTCLVGRNIHTLPIPHPETGVNAVKTVFSKVTLAALIQELYGMISSK